MLVQSASSPKTAAPIPPMPKASPKKSPETIPIRPGISSWPISLKKSVSNFEINQPGHSKVLDCEPLVVSGWVRDWHRYQVRQLSEVLGRCCEKELIASAIRSYESEPIELENSFERGEQHFNFLAQSSGSAAFPRACDLACHVTSAFIDRSRHVPGRLLWTASGL